MPWAELLQREADFTLDLWDMMQQEREARRQAHATSNVDQCEIFAFVKVRTRTLGPTWRHVMFTMSLVLNTRATREPSGICYRTYHTSNSFFFFFNLLLVNLCPSLRQKDQRFILEFCLLCVLYRSTSKLLIIFLVSFLFLQEEGAEEETCAICLGELETGAQMR